MSDTGDRRFQEQLAVYAEVAVRIGLNLQPGQRLLVSASTEAAALTRLIAAEAYRAGAELVDVLWSDPGVTLARFRHAPTESFDLHPTWRGEAFRQVGERGDAVLYLHSPNPNLLAGQDPEKLRLHQRATDRAMRPYNEARDRQRVNWTIVSVPNDTWAASVFPDLPTEAGRRRLWEAIFEAVRLNEGDPVAAWNNHIADLNRVLVHLNGRRYARLHYRAPGTDLEVRLPEEHRWMSARFLTDRGTPYIANLPTEEVFTSPHSGHTEGTVAASLPLSYGGILIENFGLRFEAGQVVEAWAESGHETLMGILATDEGARHLGEVALVPHASPISQSGLLYYDSLFDENAACHLALGRGFTFTVDNWQGKSDEEIAAAGINRSLTHIDFMVGSSEMDIDGVRADGSVEAIMRGGEWAF